ncbi:MAG: hypothetical protein FJ148_29180 [Deltaproteobacteria bacterium]|nr:hypothetical protein [Deltaproteobacteria bacterium]
MFLDFYTSDLQSTYLVWPVPLAFLAWLLPTGGRAATTSDARFVRAYATFFAVETVLDALATGPLTKLLGLAGTPVGLVVLLFFVLLGDFRVLLLLQRLAFPESARERLLAESAAWTLAVPLAALALREALTLSLDALGDNAIWLIYELCFLALALWLRQVGLPRWVGPGRPLRLAYLRSVATYVAVYYALWASADVLIQILGLDVGWALRVIPNQLYYAFFVPFAYFRYFASGADQNAASTSAQASR